MCVCKLSLQWQCSENEYSRSVYVNVLRSELPFMNQAWRAILHCYPSKTIRRFLKCLCRKSQDSVFFLLFFHQILFTGSGCLMSNLFELNVLNIFSRDLKCLNIMSFYSTILWKILFLSVVSFPTNSIDQSEKNTRYKKGLTAKKFLFHIYGQCVLHQSNPSFFTSPLT